MLGITDRPIGRSRGGEVADDVHAQRLADAAQLRELQAVEEARQFEAQTKVAHLEALVREQETVLAETLRQLADARRNALKESIIEMDRLRSRLWATCSPQIAEFTRAIEDRRVALPIPAARYERNALGERIVVASTVASVRRAYERMTEIILYELRAIELEALSDDELAMRLDALAASIPAVTMEAV